MKLLPLLTAILLLCTKSFSQNHLFPIIEKNKWGYINQEGKTIIKPQFLFASKFSENLAAVRIGGYYGYIDTLGNVVIAPTFDHASEFVYGLAQVHIDGKPFFINKSGTIIFQHPFKYISPFKEHTFTKAITYNNKSCLIDRNGKMITDTIFKYINQDYSNEPIIVCGFNHLPYGTDTSNERHYEIGTIDSNGHFIVPYGIYKDISPYINGFAKVEFIETPKEVQEPYYEYSSIINRNGEIKFIVPNYKYRFRYNGKGYFDNLLLVDIKQNIKDNSSYPIGAIDTNGTLIFSDSTWIDITPFTNNRAFVKTNNKKWKLINKEGKYINDSAYDRILSENHGDNEYAFINGVTYVETTNGWTMIDTNGNSPISYAILSNTENPSLTRKNDFIFIQKYIENEKNGYDYLYGFWNCRKLLLVKPKYNYIGKTFNSDITCAFKKTKMLYITNTGKVIWKQKKEQPKGQKLNIDYMNRSCYLASSAFKEELNGFGGWGTSENSSKKIATKKIRLSDSSTLQVIIDTTKRTNWYGHRGIKIYVVNASKDTLYFNAQNSRIYLNLQAQKTSGEWADIEYIPNSWCGNSYHTLFLSSGEYWELEGPSFSGSINTKIRAKLAYRKKLEQNHRDIVYSNEISGSVNPAQFWNKLPYKPNGIMDSYSE